MSYGSSPFNHAIGWARADRLPPSRRGCRLREQVALVLLTLFAAGCPEPPAPTPPPPPPAAVSDVTSQVEALVAASEFDAARTVLDAQIQRGSAVPRHFFLRGYLRALDGDYELALADLNEALRLAPETPEFLVQRGTILLELDQPDAALANVRAALSREPDRADGHCALGNIYHQRGDLRAAIAALASAASLEPSNGDYHLALANFRTQADELELAQADAGRAVEAAKSGDYLEQCLETRGEIRAELGDFPGAIADYRAALKLVPLPDKAVWIAALGGGTAELERMNPVAGDEGIAAAYFLGKESLEDTLLTAGRSWALPDPDESAREQACTRCRMNVWAGLWLETQRGDQAGARRLYAAAVELEPRVGQRGCYSELRLAKARLRKLGE